jgi:hypothetical protein
MSKTNNFFNFFPVGQGVFYCGLVDEGQYSFVYDCGTETLGVNLKTYMNFLYHWNGQKQLDFVAISHFHKDHISGIKDLERLIGFKKIYLPYICDNELVRDYLIGVCFFEISEGENSSILDKEYEYLFETYIYLLSLYSREGSISAKAYQNISVHNWEFKFFNKPIPETKETQLIVEINSLLRKEGVSKVADLFRCGKIDEIRNIYRKVFGGNNLNETSLVLLHYPVLYGTAPTTAYYPNAYGLSLNKTLNHYFYPYTLLTGDILFDASFSETIISQYPTGISGFVQVPHHGSKHNWPSLISCFKTFNCYIVPFGTTNSYGHPDASLKGAVPPKDYFEVNEYCGFPYWIYN